MKTTDTKEYRLAMAVALSIPKRKGVFRLTGVSFLCKKLKKMLQVGAACY